MDFICLPIFFGCPTKLKQDQDTHVRVCPRCNNVAVISAKSRMWFELCFIPLIPMNSKHVWLCTMCQWEVPHQQGYEPQLPGPGFHPGNAPMWQGGGPPPPPQAAYGGYGYGHGQGQK